MSGQMSKRMPAILALADGTVFQGVGFGANGSQGAVGLGEVVFNTSMGGYQEILTDPSYAGQMVTFTCPHIGNVGCNEADMESSRIFASGVIIRDLTLRESNFRSQESLDAFLLSRGVPGIAGIDTRKLVCHLRDHGAQMGAIGCDSSLSVDELIDRARQAGSMEGKNYVRAVTCDKPFPWNEGTFQWSGSQQQRASSGSYRAYSQEELASRPHVVALDCGIKYNILRLLVDVGFRVTVVPATSGADEIRALNPDALFLSNGPGDPATLGDVVSCVSQLIGQLPIFGICLGHQILGQVFGARTYKLKFGHRGGNHPVMDLGTKKVEITVQNHGFAVDPSGLRREVEVSHLNLNDQTVEGLSAPGYRAFSVQYHPESSPGPHDSNHLFRRFFELVVTP